MERSRVLIAVHPRMVAEALARVLAAPHLVIDLADDEAERPDERYEVLVVDHVVGNPRADVVVEVTDDAGDQLAIVVHPGGERVPVRDVAALRAAVAGRT